MSFIFMDFKLPRIEDGETVGWDIISIALDHIAAICACDEPWRNHSFIELDSGKTYEVEGYAEDILREIMDVIRESRS